MNILYLFHYKKHNHYDHHLHADFAVYMNRIPGIKVMGYGLDLEQGYPDFCPMKYNFNTTLEDIHKMFPFDAIVVNTKGRCFEYYNPHTDVIRGAWLPKDFAGWNHCPKLILEEDYHYEVDDIWYKEMGFDLILQRHYSQSLRQNLVPMMFFPFSVDTSLFNTTSISAKHRNMEITLPSNAERLNRIAFVGNDGDKAYIYRFKAIRRLVEMGIADNYSLAEPNAIRRLDGEYVRLLRSYIAHISCGSTFEICAAKNLEIMATGSILFTNKFLGIDKLFPENCYVSYENDWSDLEVKADKILTDSAFVVETRRNALKCINERHTHEIRIKQLLNIIGDLKCGKSI